jgi:DNA gyrase subunit A
MPEETKNPPADQTAQSTDPHALVKTEFGMVRKAPIIHEMEKSYLDYAMSVIVSRALPDVRDGLKPVHRRILYAMRAMGIHWNSGYKKSARIVGEVLGKFHPHGDTAVYDALVRLAQDFSMRYALIDGQGNFGSVDGDSAAAMRYTEARLSRISEELLADIDKETVNFADNFDGSQQEPTVLPAKYPNLLLMGAEGIAVGMATKIPPHNLTEVFNALTATIQNGKAEQEKGAIVPTKEEELQVADPKSLSGSFSSEITVDQIMEHVKGPDFPTGGVIYDWNQIKEGYATGKGRIVIRAVAAIEEGKSGKYQIIISELPYQVNKAKLVAKIAQLVRDKKVVGISDLRDESDRDGLRVVVELKRDAKPKSVLNNLYKYTELQTSFPLNMVALNSEGTPQLMNIKTVLVEYIRHRQIVIVRRSQYELKAARDRAHILEGLLIALNHLDDVIDTIRKSPDSDTAKSRLMTKFKLSELQATAILDMQLRRLAALERQKIEDEYKAIKQIIKDLCVLLSHPDRVLAVITKEGKEVMDQFGDERLTKLHKGKIGEFSEEDLIANEPTIITVTETGYVKRMSPTVYRTQQRGGVGVTGMTTKDEDAIKMILTANTHDSLLLLTNKGRVFKLKVHELPESGRQAKGTSIVNLINLQAEERLQTMIAMNDKDVEGKYIALATNNGLVKKTKLSDYQNIRTNGIIAIILKDGDELVWGKSTSGKDDIMLVTFSGKSIRFPESEIKVTARDTQGVRAIMLNEKDHVVGVETIPADLRLDDKKSFMHLLLVTEKGMGKRTLLSEYPIQKRAGQGVKVAEVTAKTGQVAGAMLVDETNDEVVLTTKSAQVIKLPLKNIPVLKRPTQGVILMRFSEKDDAVVAVTTTKKSGDGE